MDIKAYGKINLSLDVTGVLENGFHSVSMLMQSVELCDIVSVNVSQSKKITVTCDNPNVPDGEENIAYKAAKLMVDNFNILHGFDIKIKKKIPLCGGMAGGSTDAAAVLRAINELACLNLSQDELMKLALPLGADIPFCIQAKPALAEGIGEKLTKIKGLSSGYSILLVNPNCEISTKEIYKLVDKKKSFNEIDNNELIKALAVDDLQKAKLNMKNIFEEITAEICPKIKEIIKALYSNGGSVALMSGSGATCYGVFEDEKMAKEAKKTFADCFTAVTHTIE